MFEESVSNFPKRGSTPLPYPTNIATWFIEALPRQY